MDTIPPSEITPEHVYLSRRKFIVGLGALAAGVLFLDACGMPNTPTPPGGSPQPPTPTPPTDELGDKATSYQDITHYNNYYEFSQSKTDVADLSKDFRTSPWTLSVGGMVDHPRTYAIEDLEKKYPSQERVYRMRCVEAWSMVIPWLGFPLADLLNDAGPTSAAQYVRFEAILDPKDMPGQSDGFFSWPYVEGLRLDEAMHPLTLLSTGLYGKPLPPQDGAPIRLVVPWKYGFKSIKAIVKIDLVKDMPQTFWMTASPGEYGFYANVNPDVPHPRWPQSSERRIGQAGRVKTLLFNGYNEVAPLYQGMDLKKNF